MENRSGILFAVAGWFGALAQFVVSHISFALSVLCAGAAFIASVYSIMVSRAQIRKLKDETERLESRKRK
jgi:hypothetical protein